MQPCWLKGSEAFKIAGRCNLGSCPSSERKFLRSPIRFGGPNKVKIFCKKDLEKVDGKDRKVLILRARPFNSKVGLHYVWNLMQPETICFIFATFIRAGPVIKFQGGVGSPAGHLDLGLGLGV